MKKMLAIAFATKYLNVIVQMGIMMILSRLLTPKEFGVVTVVSVFVAFFNILGNTGINTAIVQNKTLDHHEISSIYKITLVIGLVLGICFALFANAIALFYDDSVYKGIARLLAFSVFFSVAAMVPQALLQKDKDFKTLGIINISATAISGITAIILALYGASSYAIVFQSIAFSLLTWILSYKSSHLKLQKGYSKSAIQKIRKYSMYQFLFNIINYFARNADNMLIGKFLGPVELGYYGRAYQLMLMPIQRLTFVISPVLHPVLSEKQDDKKTLYQMYLPVIQGLAFIGMLIGPLCVFNAEEILAIAFGNQWRPAAIPFAILSITIPFQLLGSTSGSVFQASNDTYRLFWIGLLNSTLIVGSFSFALAVWQNLEAVAIGVCIGYILVFFTTFYTLICKTLQASLRPFFKTLFPFVLGGGVLSLFLQQSMNQPFFKEDWSIFLYQSILGTCLYLSCIFLIPSGRSVFKLFTRSKKQPS